MSFLSRFILDLNKREVDRYKRAVVEQANKLEPELEQLSEKELKKLVTEIREEIQQKVKEQLPELDLELDELLKRQKAKTAINLILDPYEAKVFAITREMAKRTLSMRHYDEQLIGGAVLHRGQIAEMQTGEGKTLVATLPLVLNALTGLGAHLITVNDYLARRDAGWNGPLYRSLGLTVGVITPQLSAVYDPDFSNEETDPRLKNLRPVSRKEAYAADITYGTNNEFGFDYLRDNMAQNTDNVVQRELVYAIVDEVDSILIDEARTPLIISSFSNKSAENYKRFAEIIPKLKPDDYIIDEKNRTAALTDVGINKVERSLGIDNLYHPDNSALVHFADASLRAHVLFKKNKEYVVKDDQVVIIDEFTGRMLHGRRYSGGLHQAIEAKEKVLVQEESITLATITFQNYFRIYFKLAGMTGTAATEAEEFSKIYRLEVVSVPTHRQSQRKDLGDQIYRNELVKLNAITQRVKELQAKGQPVLIGTVSIAKSEKLSKLLKSAGIKHQVLNAKFHQKEGEVISLAGLPGAVTVATNMAGRGVDIVLGGPHPEKSNKEKVKEWQDNHQEVINLGGLHVIGTERHESRRIDNQLRGRAGRQGDPGSTQFYLSMEDDLMRIFGGDRMKGIMTQLKVPDDMPINNKILSKAIEQAQTKVEGHNFDQRKQLVDYDDVMNKQRTAIYSRRKRALLASTEEELEQIHQEVMSYFEPEEEEQYLKKIKRYGSELMLQAEKSVLLRSIDSLWVEHLTNLEDLRESIGLRGYGQRDPKVEYKQEAYLLFKNLETAITNQVKQMLLKIEIESRPQVQTAQVQNLMTNKEESTKTALNNANKVGRNDPCPCGAVDPKTNRPYKYKKCGLINAPHHRR